MLNVLGKPSSWYSRECHLKQSSTTAEGAQARVGPFPPTTMDVSMLQNQSRNLLKDASKAQIGSEVAYTLNSSWNMSFCFVFFLCKIPQLCVQRQSLHVFNSLVEMCGLVQPLYSFSLHK